MGMANSTWTYPELRDLEEINFYNAEAAKRPNDTDMSDILARIQKMGRDNARTPLQWDDTPHAGFSTAEKATPWIKINDDYREWNIHRQEQDPRSVLSFWKDLLRLRKEHTGLVYGVFRMVDPANEYVYAYTRTDEEQGEGVEYLVVCSFSGEAVDWKCPVVVSWGDLLLSNYEGPRERGESESGGKKEGEVMKLKPYETRLYRRKS